MSINPEKVFCSIAQTEYDTIVSLINSILLLTPSSLRLLKSSINFYNQFTLNVIDTQLTLWEKRFLTMFPELSQAGDFDKNSPNRMAFCQAAYYCQAVIETMFPETGDDPSWVQDIPEDIRNILRIGSTDSTYEIFEKYVCKLSFRSVLERFRLYMVSQLESLIVGWLEMLGTAKIDEWISDYIANLGATGIFEALYRLDKFMSCYFSTCNFARTAANYKADSTERLQMEQVGDGYRFKSVNWVNDVNTYELNLRARINALQDKLVIYSGSTKATGSGTTSDEIMG